MIQHRLVTPTRRRLAATSVLTYAIDLLLPCVMTIRSRTAQYISLIVAVVLILQAPVVTGQSNKSGVSVSYEQSGASRIARFKNSNPYHVRLEFSYQGTKSAVQVRLLVQTRFWCRPIFPPRMAPKGLASRRFGLKRLCGWTEMLPLLS